MKYTVCYDSLSVYNNTKEAKDFYKDCYYSSEGAEQARYASILMELDIENQNVAVDNSSDGCRDIYIHLNNYIESPIKITLENEININDTINYFKAKVLPVFEITEKSEINFNSKIPFEHYGSDVENYNLASISDFYSEILQSRNIKFKDITTTEKSDGKYLINIDNVLLDTTAWDDFNAVLNNVNSLENELKKDKEGDMNYE